MKRLFSLLSTWRLAAVVMIATIVFVLMLLNVAAVHAEGQTAPPAFAAGEIQFCPKGKPYQHASCEAPRTTMKAAIQDALDAAATGMSGTIYVEGDQSYSNDTYDNSGTQILVNGFNYGTSLTIQGGMGIGTTTFVRTLSYQGNNDLDFTLADVTITSSIGGDDGIYASSNTGDLTLQNVITNSNSVNGIYIASYTGDISLEQITTNNNGGEGIYVNSLTGKISMQDVIANQNTINIDMSFITGDCNLSQVTANDSTSGNGIYASTCEGKKGVIFNTVTANDNSTNNISVINIPNNVSLNGVTASSAGSTGISLYNIHGSKGVTMKDVTASGNADYNISFGNIDGNVALTGVQADNSLSQDGINIGDVYGSKGITLKDVTANGNNGFNIYAAMISGNASLTDVTANSASTMLGIYMSNINGSKGISMKNVVANENNGTNIHLYQTTSNISIYSVAANLSATGMGISIYTADGTKGVTMKGVAANTNNGQNIYIYDIVGNVTLSTIEANGSVASHGMNITSIQGSKGVTMKIVTADGNNLRNISIANITGNVVLSGIAANSSTTAEGLYIQTVHGSKGINLKNVTAEYNQLSNVHVRFIDGDASLSAVYANYSGFPAYTTGNYGVYLDGIYGAKGVTLKNVTANSNYETNVAISGIDNNASLIGVNANDSYDASGIYMLNIAGIKGVTMKNTIANENHSDNINITTVASGNVIMTNVIANLSVDSYGINLHNILGSKGVSFKNVTANQNHDNNYRIENIDPGSVVLNNVQGNTSVTGFGIYVQTIAGSLMGINSTFTGNDSDGIYADTITGLIAFKSVTANGNGDSGLFLMSDTNQLMCSSEFSSNADYGIVSTTTGDSLTLSAVVMTGNGINDDPQLTNTTPFYSTKCKVIPVP